MPDREANLSKRDHVLSALAGLFLLVVGLLFLFVAVSQGAPDWIPYVGVGAYLMWRAPS